MAKNIKNKLWAQHLDMSIPELTEEKMTNSISRLEQVKLTNPEKNSQLVQGIVVSCEAAWRLRTQEEAETNEVVVDASSLWKVCSQRKDIYKLANSLQYRIHCEMHEVYAKIDVSCDEVTVTLISLATMKTPFVEEWLTSKINQRQTELTFNKLESFYKTQPVWVKHRHDFMKFLKTLFETVKKIAEHLVSYKIDKQEKKIILQYA